MLAAQSHRLDRPHDFIFMEDNMRIEYFKFLIDTVIDFDSLTKEEQEDMINMLNYRHHKMFPSSNKKGGRRIA